MEDAVDKHPEDPGRTGGDLGQVEPKTVLGVAGGTVHPPVWDGNLNRGVRGRLEDKEKRWRVVLTGDAAVDHPADHAEQEEQIAHEVSVIPTSC